MAGIGTPSQSSTTTIGTVTAKIQDSDGNSLNSTTGALHVNIQNASVPVTGTFWQATQPVSGSVTANAGTNLNTSALALESGGNLATIASAISATHMQVDVLSAPSTIVTATNLDIRDLTSVSDSVAAVCTNAGTFAVQAAQSGTWNITNISGTVSLPTGAATAVKQPALGTAGTASADVITVQGIASMTPVQVSQSTASNLNVQAVGNIASGSSDSGNPLKIGGVYNSTQPTVTTGQRVDLQTDARGNLMTYLATKLDSTNDSITAVQSTAASLNATVVGTGTFATQATLQTQTDTVMVGGVNIKEINGVTPLMGNGTTGTGSQRVTISSDNTVLPAVGAGATGATIPANASYTGINASTALPAAATAGNLTGEIGDKFGRQVVLPVTIRDLVGTQTTTLTTSTSETTIVTQTASVFHDLIALIISNTSATAARLDFRDTTGGSVLFSIYVPAGDTRGFSMGGVPIPQTSVNTNWTAQSSASVTSIYIYAVFASNK